MKVYFIYCINRADAAKAGIKASISVWKLGKREKGSSSFHLTENQLDDYMRKARHNEGATLKDVIPDNEGFRNFCTQLSLAKFDFSLSLFDSFYLMFLIGKKKQDRNEQKRLQ